MSEEFDAYGANKALVHDLVEHDVNAKSFFEFIINSMLCLILFESMVELLIS